MSTGAVRRIPMGMEYTDNDFEPQALAALRGNRPIVFLTGKAGTAGTPFRDGSTRRPIRWPNGPSRPASTDTPVGPPHTWGRRVYMVPGTHENGTWKGEHHEGHRPL